MGKFFLKMGGSLLATDEPYKNQCPPRVTAASNKSFQPCMRDGTVAAEKIFMTVNTFGNIFGEQEIKINTKTKT